jgi:uncharacterized protein YndB with AHSA1/START domain
MCSDPQVERQLDLPIPPGDVWEYLTDGDLLGEWFDGEMEIDPRAGGNVSFADDFGKTRHGRVEEIDTEHLLAWTWSDDEEDLLSRVEFRLDPIGGGTRLTVTETLLPWEFHYHQPLLIHSDQPFSRSPMALV